MVRLGRRQKSRRWARIGQTLRERSPTRRASTFLSHQAGNGTGPRAAKRIHPQAGRVLVPQSEYTRKRDGSSGRKAASALPRCLRHPKTRPVKSDCGTRRPVPLANPPHPAAPRPQIAAQRRTGRPKNRKRGVSPGLTRRRMGASDARRAKAQRTSERARAWMARSERPEGQPRAHPERPRALGESAWAHPERPSVTA